MVLNSSWTHFIYSFLLPVLKYVFLLKKLWRNYKILGYKSRRQNPNKCFRIICFGRNPSIKKEKHVLISPPLSPLSLKNKKTTTSKTSILQPNSGKPEQKHTDYKLSFAQNQKKKKNLDEMKKLKVEWNETRHQEQTDETTAKAEAEAKGVKNHNISPSKREHDRLT